MKLRSTLKILSEKGDPGYTLIEVLISLIILSVILFGGVAMGTGIIKGNVLSDKLITATVLAQEKMEDLRRLGYSAAADSTEEYGSITNHSLFKRIVSVAADTPAINMKLMSVTVYWDSDNKAMALNNILVKEG